MSFSAFNVGRQMMVQTGNVLPQQNFGSRPIAGGSFTPNTLEAAFVLRSNLDYQFEKAFIDKHRATMQNRLNEVSKKLEEAYKDLLNVSMSQQIGEGADRNLRADVRLDGTDGTNNAQLISGILGENGFEDLGVDPSGQNGINYGAPGSGNVGSDIWRSPNKGADLLAAAGPYGDDGVFGYSRSIGSDAVQFRALTERTTAAGNIGGEMDITLRIEDDPPTPAELNGSLEWLTNVTSAITGGAPEPTYFNQQVAQYSASYSTGGFWSSVNYLYNFAPREIKYSYAVGYTVNSDEAGNDEYLVNGELVDYRDVPSTNTDTELTSGTYLYTSGTFDPGIGWSGTNMWVSGTLDPTGSNGGEWVITGTTGSSDPDSYLFNPNRVKWSSNNPLEGYQHERSGTSSTYPTVTNRQKAWLNEDPMANTAWDIDPTHDKGLTHVVENLIFQSGTYTYDGSFVNNTGGHGNLVQTQANSNGTMVDLIDSNIQLGTVFRHTVDMTENANEDDVTEATGSSDFQVNDRGRIRSSLFFNHYEVETRTVEFNNKNNIDVAELTDVETLSLADDAAGNIYVKGGIARSSSIDATKSYDNVKVNPSDPDSATEISRSTGNVSKTFNGEFLHSLHKIQSINGQDVVGNENKQASPTIGNFELGRYEGVERSFQMNRNIVDYTPPSDMEINAANTVPTDWYQAEMLVSATQNPQDPNNGKIWFPHVEDTLYSAPGSDGYGRAQSERQVIQARNTFSVTRDELMNLRPATQWVTDATGTVRPTYEKKDMYIDVELTGIHYNNSVSPPQTPKIFINGREYDTIVNTPVAQTNHGSNVSDVTYRINLNGSGDSSFLQEGLNTMTIQTSDGTFVNALGGTNASEGIKVTATPHALYPPGTTTSVAEYDEVIKTLNSKVITGYASVEGVPPDVKYSAELTRPDTIKALSRWQTRLVPRTVENDASSKLARMSSTQESTGSSNKSVNSFIEMVISMMNDRKYKDVFKLGLMSNLNKLAINGQAQLPSGSSMQGAISMYYDMNEQRIVVTQDKLVAQSRAA